MSDNKCPVHGDGICLTHVAGCKNYKTFPLGPIVPDYGAVIAALEKRVATLETRSSDLKERHEDLSAWQDGILQRIAALETASDWRGGMRLEPQQRDERKAALRGRVREKIAAAKIGAAADALPTDADDERIVDAAMARAMGGREVKPMGRDEPAERCGSCGGSGEVPRQAAFGVFVSERGGDLVTQKCVFCNGTGRKPQPAAEVSYQPRAAVDVLFDPPKFPDPPRKPAAEVSAQPAEGCSEHPNGPPRGTECGACNYVNAQARDGSWQDKPLPEDDAIKAAHPTRTGRHDLYAEAMGLVGAKRSKSALVELVNWLLYAEAGERQRADGLAASLADETQRRMAIIRERNVLDEALRRELGEALEQRDEARTERGRLRKELADARSYLLADEERRKLEGDVLQAENERAAAEAERDAALSRVAAFEGSIAHALLQRDEAADAHADELGRVCEERDAAYRRAEKLAAALRSIRDNWDCDADAHKYGTGCRACEATEALADLDALEKAGKSEG